MFQGLGVVLNLELLQNVRFGLKPRETPFLFSVGDAMILPLRWIGFASVAHQVVHAPGWWASPFLDTNLTEENATRGDSSPTRPSMYEPTALAGWVYNQTSDFWAVQLDAWDVTGFTHRWDSWVWTIVDTLFSTVGWVIFGNSWTQVRSGCSMLIRFSVLMTLCVAAHYILALCWPIVSLLVGIILAAIWIVRSLVKCCGRTAFWIHRWSGGAPEALVAEFFGPGTGSVPETSDLRKLKKSNEWVLVKREGKTVIFRVSEASSIKSSGLYLTVEPETMRGDPDLVNTLKGFDRVHACRNEQCSEDGQHFKLYAVSKDVEPGKFQLATTSQEVQRAGKRVFDWLSTGAVQAAKRAKDYASESETEQPKCVAHQIRWEGAKGTEPLSDQVCTVCAVDEVELLVEDRVGLAPKCSLCPRHTVKYHQSRLQLKCVKEGCQKLGQLTEQGLRLCGEHGELVTTSSTTSRRSSRSRSRHREPLEDMEDEEEEEDIRLRRRVRVHRPKEEDDVAGLLQEVKEEQTTKPRASRVRTHASPGHTPKSSVQRNLARMGLVNSPDKRAFQTTLEEFMEQFAEGKDFGLEEEDVRKQ